MRILLRRLSARCLNAGSTLALGFDVCCHENPDKVLVACAVEVSVMSCSIGEKVEYSGCVFKSNRKRGGCTAEDRLGVASVVSSVHVPLRALADSFKERFLSVMLTACPC